MRINTKELRTVTEKLFDHLEELQIEYIDVPRDFYWDLSGDQLYDVQKEPDDLVVGQLSDDWQELHKVLNERSDPMSYHFVWLSSILRVIGEQIVH